MTHSGDQRIDDIQNLGGQCPPYRATSAITVAVVCLAMQLAYLGEGYKDPTFDIPIIDAAVYHDAAARFGGGEPLSEDAFWQPPLFPLLLGFLYRLAGERILVAKCALAGLAVLSCLLLLWIGSRVFSRRVGVIGGLMLAVYGPFLFFSTQLLPTGLAVFLCLLALAQWLRCLEQPRWHGWLLLGLTIGAAAITVPNAAVLLVVVLALGPLFTGRRINGLTEEPVPPGGAGHGRALGAIYRLRLPKANPRGLKPAARCAITILGMAIPIGSVTARNYLVAHEWVVISTNGGINFYIGNNPRSDDTIAVRAGEPWRRLVRESYAHGAGTRAEQSAYFFKEGFEYLVDQPFDYVHGMGRKTLRLINAREIPRNVDPYVFREFSHLLSLLLWQAGPFFFPFGLLAPLAAVGVVASNGSARRDDLQRAGRLGLLTFIAAYGGSIVLFFVSSRYRLPMVVVMTLFAANGAVWVWEQLVCAVVSWRASRGGRRGLGRTTQGQVPADDEHRRGRRLRYASVVAFIAVALMVNVPITVPTDRVNFRAELAMCVGHAYAANGQFGEAERHLRQALKLDPQYVTAAAKLAGVLAEHGKFDEAEKLLRKASDWDEQSTEARASLGSLLYKLGRSTEAFTAYEEALSIDATSPETLVGLADALVENGRVDEAVERYRQAVDLVDEPGPVLIRLGDALVERGAYEEAIERYRQGLWRVEPEAATLNRIAWVLATCPIVELRDCEHAIEIAQHLCEITEHAHPVALDTLAAAYAECGRWADAVAWGRRAIATALAQGDTSMADSFRPRLKIYKDRLAEHAKGRTEPGVTPPHEEP